MSKIHVTAKRDHLESLTKVKRPLDAVAQLIWNGLDAQTNRVVVSLDHNAMFGLQSIRVQDSGTGIAHENVKSLFGNLGESWKKSKAKLNGRSLHGKNGVGRFKAFSLGAKIEWNTTYQRNGKAYSYTITGDLNTLDDFDCTKPQLSTNIETGTEVVVSNLLHNFRSLSDHSTPLELARIFAAYLSQYPEISIDYNGNIVDPEAVQLKKQDYDLGKITLDSGKHVTANISVVEWKVPTKRYFHLCDNSGVSLHDIEIGPQVRAPGFEFTAYVKCDHFRELDKEDNLTLDDLHCDVDAILKPAKTKVKEHFRRRLAEEQGQIVERWKEENIYPYEDKPHLDPIEEVERQVFDILAVNVQSYLPSFEDADSKSKRFTFRLLSQAIRENPDSVQEIITEVLGLKKEEQNDLAELLRKTPLSSIISSAKIVANRLNFLVALENLLFDQDTKKLLLERDQLHKILENEAWLFHEEFALAASEQRLEEVLSKHISHLGQRADDSDPVTTTDGRGGRIDLMLSKATQPRTGQFDYLIVELKRPSKKVDAEVITQIKKYAIAVAKDERFNSVPAKWTFIAVSNELDEFAKREAREQRNRPVGLVYDDAKLNITVWVKEWAEVINDARSRLRFINTQLSYEADRDSSKAYLKRTHAKFIPLTAQDEEQIDESEMSAAEQSTPK